MVVSAPILSSKTSNLDNSLGQIERTLKNIDLNLYSRHASAIAELKNTISSLEVAHLKRTALAEGVFDFYPKSLYS